MFVLMALYHAAGPATRACHNTIANCRTFIANFGLNTFLETEWARLSVPTLLRVFWLSRMAILLLGEVARVARSDIWGNTDYAWHIVAEHSVSITNNG